MERYGTYLPTHLIDHFKHTHPLINKPFSLEWDSHTELEQYRENITYVPFNPTINYAQTGNPIPLMIRRAWYLLIGTTTHLQTALPWPDISHRNTTRSYRPAHNVVGFKLELPIGIYLSAVAVYRNDSPLSAS